jgi:hypothetical protein
MGGMAKLKWLHSQDLKERPFLVVLLIEMGSVGYAAAIPEHWLRAVGGMTIGMLIAGLLRLLLSDEQAGLLRVRRRPFDVACYWVLGVLAITFGLALPR